MNPQSIKNLLRAYKIKSKKLRHYYAEITKLEDEVRRLEIAIHNKASVGEAL